MVATEFRAPTANVVQLLVLLALLAVIDSSAQAPIDSLPDNAWLEIHLIDVGQGDGLWIHTFDDGIPGNGRFQGKNIVIDGGPVGADAKNPLLIYLQHELHGTNTIDALILTHPHVDHFPGAIGVVRHYDVCDYYDPAYPDSLVSYQHFLDAVALGHCGNHRTTMHMGLPTFGTLDWGNEIHAEFLYAYPGSPDGLGRGNTLVNNASVVLKITYGTQSILLMGDAEGKERDESPETVKFAEAWLLQHFYADSLHATVLKAGHHGSETSSTLPFIRAVNPDIVLISSGRKSFSGTFLPDASTLKRFCDANPNVRIYRTDQDDELEGRTNATAADHDDVVIRMNGKRTEVVAHSNGRVVDPPSCSN